MSRTYTSRPPTTARAARKAWDYFTAKRTAGGRRPIRELFYSQWYGYLNHPHWVCVLEILPSDTMRWKFSEEDVTWAEPAHQIAESEHPANTQGEQL